MYTNGRGAEPEPSSFFRARSAAADPSPSVSPSSERSYRLLFEETPPWPSADANFFEGASFKPATANAPRRRTSSTGIHGVARRATLAAASMSTSASQRASSFASAGVMCPTVSRASAAMAGSVLLSAPPSSATFTVRHASRTKHRSHSLRHCSIGGSAPSAKGTPPRATDMDSDPTESSRKKNWASAPSAALPPRLVHSAPASALRRSIRNARSRFPGRIASVSSSFLFRDAAPAAVPPPGCRV